MFGDGTVDEGENAVVTIKKTWAKTFTAKPSENDKFEYGTKELIFSKISNRVHFYDAKGEEVATPSVATPAAYMTAEIPTKDIGLIEISASTFPGTYYVTGDTFARSEVTGEDEFFQFIIPKAKMNAENTITLEAEGDPSVFNMTLRVLRPADGKMMKLVKYNVDVDKAVEVANG